MNLMVVDDFVEVERLRARVEELEFIVDELRGSSTDWAAVQARFNVGRKCAAVMILLSGGRVCSYNQMLLAAGSPDATEQAVRTYVKLARASSPDVVIKTLYGGCYQMGAETCRLVQSLLKQEAAT